MAPDGIVFALANPTPEVHPEIAARYAAIVATGRSDFPNQINNVLAFPGSSGGPSTPARRGSPRDEAGRRHRDRRRGRRRLAGRRDRAQPARPPGRRAVAAAVAACAREQGVTSLSGSPLGDATGGCSRTSRYGPASWRPLGWIR